MKEFEKKVNTGSFNWKLLRYDLITFVTASAIAMFWAWRNASSFDIGEVLASFETGGCLTVGKDLAKRYLGPEPQKHEARPATVDHHRV